MRSRPPSTRLANFRSLSSDKVAGRNCIWLYPWRAVRIPSSTSDSASLQGGRGRGRDDDIFPHSGLESDEKTRDASWTVKVPSDSLLTIALAKESKKARSKGALFPSFSMPAATFRLARIIGGMAGFSVSSCLGLNPL